VTLSKQFFFQTDGTSTKGREHVGTHLSLHEYHPTIHHAPTRYVSESDHSVVCVIGIKNYSERERERERKKEEDAMDVTKWEFRE